MAALADAGVSRELMTIEQWEAMPTPITGERFELVKGHIVQMPDDAVPRHNNAADNLRDLLKGALPGSEWKVVTGGTRLVEGLRPTVRIPDVRVVTHAAFAQYNEAPSLPAREVLLVAEFVSPESAKTDRVDKRAEYEAAGIPHYWIFDVRSRSRGPKLTVLRLVNGKYNEVPAGPDENGQVTIAEPVTLSFGWEQLLE